MRLKTLHRPFEIELLTLNEYTAVPHKNTYFEMVFILEGSGVQIINEHELPYDSDKLFLIFPQDSHSFRIAITTSFCFIRFNESYLKTQHREWVQKLEYIFYNYDHLPGCILKTVTDKPMVRALTEALLREQQNGGPHHQEVIQQLLNTVISIAARNIASVQTAYPYQPSHPLSMLGYVHQNIKRPEALKIEELASYFHLSPNYVGEYFKKETGESLQKYIRHYRLQMIEAALIHTNRRISEIALDFGFTDTSHLNKMFHQEYGVSPTTFRKRLLEKSGHL